MLSGKTKAQLVLLSKNDKTLREVNFSDQHIGADGALALSGALSANTTVTSINLSNNDLEREGIACLELYLASTNCLFSLDLSSNRLRITAAQSLQRALLQNASLRTLRLADNQLGQGAASHVAAGLENHAEIVELDMDNCAVGCHDAASIASMIKRSATLRTLDLNNNQLQDLGGVAIASALFGAVKSSHSHTGSVLSSSSPPSLLLSSSHDRRMGCALRHLNLADNQLGDATCVALAKPLGANAVQLVSLNLASNNDIGDDGASAIADALRANTTLVELRLDDCRVGGAGARRLAAAFGVNSTLGGLNLSLNEIDASGFEALRARIQHNATLVELAMDGNELHAVDDTLLGQMLEQIVERNRHNAAARRSTLVQRCWLVAIARCADRVHAALPAAVVRSCSANFAPAPPSSSSTNNALAAALPSALATSPPSSSWCMQCATLSRALELRDNALRAKELAFDATQHELATCKSIARHQRQQLAKLEQRLAGVEEEMHRRQASRVRKRLNLSADDD
jgi:Ran GTPase-activating protein (RanGAP) involved in mRNA processing and transport